MMYPVLLFILIGCVSSVRINNVGTIKNCVSLDDSIPSIVFRCDLSFGVEGELVGSIMPPVFSDDVGKKYVIKYPFNLELEAPAFDLGLYKSIGNFRGLFVEVFNEYNQSSCPLLNDNNGTLCQRAEVVHGKYACHRAQLDVGVLNLTYAVKELHTEHVHIPYLFKIDGITGKGYYDVLQDHYYGPVNFSSFEFTSVVNYDVPELYFGVNESRVLSFANPDSPVDSDWFSDGNMDFLDVCDHLTYIPSEPFIKGLDDINNGFILQPFIVNDTGVGYQVAARFFPKGYMSLSFSAVVGLVPAIVENITMEYDCSTGVARLKGFNSGNAGSVSIMVHYSDGPKRSNQYNEVIVSGVFQIRIASYFIEEVWIENERVRPNVLCKHGNLGPVKPTDPPVVLNKNSVLTVNESGPTIPQDVESASPSVPVDPIELKTSNPGIDSDSEGVLTVFNIPLNGYWYIIASGIAVLALASILILGSVCVYKRRQSRRLREAIGALLDTKRA